MQPNSYKRSEVDLRSYSMGNYEPGPVLLRALWLIISRLFYETHFPWPSQLKASILRFFGAEIGIGAVLKPQIKVKYPWFLQIGDHCWIGEHAWIDNIVDVTIGSHVVISQGAYLLTGNHDYKSPGFDLKTSPIAIKDGAWIAAKAIVAPGVTVDTHAVLSLGSVATSDLEASGVYLGNPAKRIRSREICSAE